MPPLIAFDKENLFAMQKQIIEGMDQPRSSQQCMSQDQSNIPDGLVKRQVIEAWKKMKCPTFQFAQWKRGGTQGCKRELRVLNNEGVHSKTLGSQDPSQCCKHFGFPYFQDKSNKREVKVNPSCEANMDKKRMEVSTEQVLGSNRHLDLSHLALIPSQMNLNYKELEALKLKLLHMRYAQMGGLSPIRSFNLERPSKLENRSVKPR